MRIHTYLLFSHLLIAAAVGIALAVEPLVGAVSYAAAIIAGTLGAGAATWLLTRKLARGFQSLRAIVDKPGQAEPCSVGIAELDNVLTDVAHHSAHWDEIAANHRQQARELQAIVMMLNRRQTGGTPTSSQLRGVLSGLGNRLQGLLSQIEQSTVEIGKCTQELAGSAETQNGAVIKAGTYVEQLTTKIEAICTEADAIEAQISEHGQATTEALKLVRELTLGLERIRSRSEASERKLRGLNDPTRQIRSIVDTIADLAGRTDLLALNASVESIRAGEHGRGFAIVADEVRKLAEQASQATREAGVLLEALQIQTQESIKVLASERGDLNQESCLVHAAESLLEKININAQADASRVKKITTSGTQQLHLAREVTVAIEQVSQVAKSDRSHADNARWAMRSLAKTTLELGQAMEVLENCSDRRNDSAGSIASEDRPSRQNLLAVAGSELDTDREAAAKESSDFHQSHVGSL